MNTQAPRPLRRCFRDPIPEIFAAAEALKAAVDAHCAGNRLACHELIVKANDPAVREWAAPFLGSSTKNPFLVVQVSDRFLPPAEKEAVRMPTSAEKSMLIARQGYSCAFCEIPLIRAEVRKALQVAYPQAAVWGRTNEECHGALLCMWLQYDHVTPHSRGGSNSPDNVVLTCAPCNYGRMSYTLAEVGLEDPRTRPWARSSWDGLEPFLSTTDRKISFRPPSTLAGEGF